MKNHFNPNSLEHWLLNLLNRHDLINYKIIFATIPIETCNLTGLTAAVARLAFKTLLLSLND